ncbi:MAG: VCBS repeat-containing protein [Parcubacteria group bacterium]|nr:VCBS repeat-containing protein [Parcubacteria group bacterium]
MKRKPKNRLKKYLFNKGSYLFEILAILLIIVIVVTLIESFGLTYKPKIEIDAYQNKSEISPDLYGYSNGSDFIYNSDLSDAVKNDGAKSLRIIDEFDPGTRMLVKIEDGIYTVLAADNVPYENGKEYNMKTKVSGSNIKIYADNELVFNVNDSTFPKGEIGLISSYNLSTSFDDVSVRDSRNRLLFSDNFSSSNSSWNNDDIYSWHDTGGWSLLSGKYNHQGKQSLSMKMAGDKKWGNYTLNLKMSSYADNPYELGFMGYSFRHQKSLSSYRFMWRSDIKQPYSSNNPWGVQDFDGQLRLAREANLEPTVTVNMKDNAQSAANLVQELNIDNDYNVKYWELGNEMYIWGDNYHPNTVYAKRIKEFSQAMKAKDPSIKIGASMLLGLANWDEELFKQSADYFDFIIFHYYPYWADSNVSNLQLLASPYAFGNKYNSAYANDKGVVDQANDLIEKYAPDRAGKIEFVVSEFNTGNYEKGKSLVYGLTTADLLGQFAEEGVKIGQFHKLGNNTDYHWDAYTLDNRAKPPALAISLFSKHFGQILTETTVTDTPTFSVPEKRNVPKLYNVPYLTAYSSKNKAEDKLYVIVVNKHNLATMRSSININNAKVKKQAKVYTLNGPTINSDNNYSDQVTIEEKNIAYADEKFSYTFPAHSVTAIELEMTEIIKPETKEGDNDNNDDSSSNDTGGRGGSDYISNGESRIVVGAGYGGNPHVKTFDKEGIPTKFNNFVYDENFRGGVSVALGDVDGDGKNEIITGTGYSGGPHVRIFEEDGREIASFFAFHEDYHGGINVAAGDVDFDGKDEVAVVQASDGQAWVKVYRISSGFPLLGEWNAYGHVECGGDVAMGDIDMDGQDEVIVGAGPGGGPQIRVFEANGALKPIQFFAFHPNYRGGVRVAAGDVDGDGKDEIGVTQAALGDQSWIKIYRYNNNQTIIGEWKAYGDYLFGADLDIGDIDNNGQIDVITGPTQGGGPQVLTFNPGGQMLPLKFYTFNPSFRGGINVSVAK